MKWVSKIAKAIWGICCLFGVILFVEDFYQALKHPELYYFGSEGPVAGLWYYETQASYLWSAVMLVCWFAAGFLLCVLQHKFKILKWGIIAHCVLTLLYMLIIHMTME